VRIVTLLPASHHQVVVELLGAKQQVHRAESVRGLVWRVRRDEIDVVLLDPALAAEACADGCDELARLLDVPILICIPMDPRAVRASLPFVRAGAVDYLFYGADETEDALTVALHRATSARLESRLLEALSPRFGHLPSRLRAGMRTLFDTRCALPSLDDIASAAQMTRRSMDRWLMRIGLAPGRRLLNAARLLRSYHALVRSTLGARAIARHVGVRTVDAWTRQITDVSGLSPAAIRDNPAVERLVQRILPRLIRDDHEALGRRRTRWTAKVSETLSDGRIAG
jgi:hypothetical protein